MKFGTAKECITPKMKTKVACCGKFDIDYEYVHDDVFVRCIIFDDGTNKAALFTFDLLFHDRSLNDALAAYAFEKHGIDRAAVCVTYTHAHTAPAVKGYNPGHHTDAYEDYLIQQGQRCLDAAFANRFEGTMEYGSTTIDLNISRRGQVDGKFGNYPNFDYPHDTELFVLCMKDPDQHVRAVFVNYACHPVFYPAQLAISGEFPGQLCRHLEARYPGATALFAQSAGGDVRPAPTVDRHEDDCYGWKSLSFDDIDAFSAALCEKVTDVLNGDSLKTEPLSLAANAFSVRLEMDGQPMEVFQDQWCYYEPRPDSPNRTHADRIVHGGYDALEDRMDLHCQTIRLTDRLYLATVGGEPCYGIKTALRKVFHKYALCFIGYTDACAYIPDDRILDEGGYEAECHLEYGLKGPFKKGITQRITDGFTLSLHTVHGLLK